LRPAVALISNATMAIDPILYTDLGVGVNKGSLNISAKMACDLSANSLFIRTEESLKNSCAQFLEELYDAIQEYLFGYGARHVLEETNPIVWQYR